MLVLCPLYAIAQNVYPVEAALAQPLVYRNKGDLNGCGLRTMFMTNVPEKSNSGELSINLFKEKDFYFGAAKALYHRLSRQGGTKLEAIPIKTFSLTISPNQYIEVNNIRSGEDDGSLIGSIAGRNALEFMAAIIEGKRIEVAYQFREEKGTRIFSIEFPPIDEKESKVFFDCVESLTAQN